MTPETLFLIVSYGIIVPWFLLFFAPNSRLTNSLVQAFWIPLVLASVYVVGIAFAPTGDMMSLSGVMQLFTEPWAVLAGWIHYLVFDLFVGAWQVRDARRREISRIWVTICLFFTMMLGPVGLALYGIGRLVAGSGAALEERA
ncbi:MAG: hypothetical protein ACJAYU_002613 [Bradymonadia bacterium]|jgi:hypothetical protein